jgi:Mg/Co/Ni transporter MgtE
MPEGFDLIDFILNVDTHLAELLRDYGTAFYWILFAIVFVETGVVRGVGRLRFYWYYLLRPSLAPSVVLLSYMVGVMVGATVALSLIGVVLFGSVTGSMLPFLLKRARLDPATASAPLVATLVDVTGLVIYFSVASAVLRGSLL